MRVEEVDAVLTITLAERAVEEGFLLLVMRVVPGGGNDGFDPELENYELATRYHLCEGGVREWSLAGSSLTLRLTAEAAAQLHIEPFQSFELRISGSEAAQVHEALQLAFSPVGF